ncbi:outer envelope pore protein 16-4, chloroplastic isoform X2 [Olea europaea var. sylvestris]|uniref:outer envelope pore protein 16-4, chloroplastic isoform X2 n=1 Tax=Olea europaea var. sylvestris TaxID=158386 RepID=UPI000C1CD9E7|nr:outer envelope pore protein 16-4, chloroplastic isoform X2 [Olea europaea var. sylvestris]
MERDFFDEAPCSSIAVDSIIRMGTAGVIWGSCVGPFDANKLVAKLVGQYGLHWGFFAAIFSFTHCGIQRYRGKKDWVNTFTAGVAAGAAFGAGTRNWKQVAGVTGLVCTLYHFAENSRSV